MNPIRILVADDHALIRRGIKTLIGSQAGWQLCGEANNGREAVTKADHLRPDIVILDISMPDLNGVDAAKRIRRVSPETEILMLSVHYSDQLILDILKVGVRGYVVKSDSDRDLVVAVETLANHKPFFTPRATELILRNYNQGDTADMSEPIPKNLTTREREILQLIAEGKSNKAVANSLCISSKTAETHRANIMRKLKLHTTSELVRYAMRNQIVDP
jgi:DNA-binding NarL/FixJ family response regulator